MRYVPIQIDSNTTAAFLQIDDLDIPEKDKLTPLLTFSVNTYVKLNRPKVVGSTVTTTDDSWDVTFGSVNIFFNTLSIEDRTILGKMIIMMHKDIMEFMTTEDIGLIHQLTKKLGNHLNEMDQAIDLCPKLREFVIGNIPVGLFNGAGKRAQDSEQLTFYPDEVIDLLTITLLCKMLSPVFGVIMKYTAKRIDSKSKEIQCVAVFTALVNSRYSVLISKLTNYIKHTINTCSQESMTALINGHDLNSLSYYMYATLLVRQFVNVNLGVPHGNLMTYIIVSVKRAVATFNSTILKNPTYNRMPMSAKGDDEGNQAQIEIDSMVSRKTCDVPIMIACAVEPALRRNMELFQIDADAYAKCENYYLKHTPVPTFINKNLCSMFYSQDLGGGKGIQMLDAINTVKLLTLLQMITFQLDVNYMELAHFITAVPAVTGSLESTADSSIMTLSTGSTYAYKNCKERFDRAAYGARTREWEKHMQAVVDDLKNRRYIYNTAPWLWDWLGFDNLNGQIIQPSIKVTEALCDFYDFIATEIVH